MPNNNYTIVIAFSSSSIASCRHVSTTNNSVPKESTMHARSVVANVLIYLLFHRIVQWGNCVLVIKWAQVIAAVAIMALFLFDSCACAMHTFIFFHFQRNGPIDTNERSMLDDRELIVDSRWIHHYCIPTLQIPRRYYCKYLPFLPSVAMRSLHVGVKFPAWEKLSSWNALAPLHLTHFIVFFIIGWQCSMSTHKTNKIQIELISFVQLN